MSGRSGGHALTSAWGQLRTSTAMQYVGRLFDRFWPTFPAALPNSATSHRGPSHRGFADSPTTTKASSQAEIGLIYQGARSPGNYVPAKLESFFGHIRIAHAAHLTPSGEKEPQRIDPSVLTGLYHTKKN
jgi:hypothetical protein